MATPHNSITLEQVAKILFEAIRPFYKGMPDEGDDAEYSPEFRKTLTSEEAQNLLITNHNIVATILKHIKEER